MTEMNPLPIICEVSESSMYGEPYLWDVVELFGCEFGMERTTARLSGVEGGL
jgi:hypothetical protein